MRLVGAENEVAAGAVAENTHLRNRGQPLRRARATHPEFGRNASLAGLIAYTRASQPSAAGAGGRLPSTRASLRPLPAKRAGEAQADQAAAHDNAIEVE